MRLGGTARSMDTGSHSHVTFLDLPGENSLGLVTGGFVPLLEMQELS